MTTKNNTPKTQETAKNDTTSDATPTPEPKKIKLNADSYKDWKYSAKPRVENEEKEEKGRLIHAERGKRESDGYYNARRIAFDLSLALTKTGKEFTTPQRNAEMIRELLNAKLPKERKITRFVYVARNFQLRFYPMDKPKDDFIAIDVSRPTKPEQILKSFGL